MNLAKRAKIKTFKARYRYLFCSLIDGIMEDIFSQAKMVPKGKTVLVCFPRVESIGLNLNTKTLTNVKLRVSMVEA